MADEITISVRAEDNFSGVLSNFGNIITGIRSAVDLAADAFRAAADFVGQFVNSASESQQAVFELEAVLRATGGAAGFTSEELQNMANHLQGVTRFSDEMILSGVSMLLTFRNIGEETFPRATNAMLDMATMFGSVDSAAVQLGKALNDPIAGIGALQRIGIQFTEEQKEMIQNFMDMGDIAGAQNIILKEVEMQIGGLALAMGETFAGKVDILKNKLDSLKEGIGGLIIHALTPLLDAIIEEGPLYDGLQTLIGAFETINTRVGAGLPFLQAVAMTIKELPQNSDLLATLPPVLDDIANAMMTMQSAMDNGQSIFDAFKTSLDFLARSDGPLSGIALRIQEFIQTGETEGWGAAIGGVLSDIWNALDIPERAQNLVIGLVNNLTTSLSGADWSGVQETLTDVLSGIVTNVLTGLSTIVAGIDWGPLGIAVKDALWSMLTGAMEGIGDGFWRWFGTEVFNDESVESFWTNTQIGAERLGEILLAILFPPSLLDDFFNKGLEAAKSMVEGLFKAFEDVNFPWSNWIREHLIDPIKRLLGIASPSTVFKSLGGDIIDGLLDGLKGGWTSVKTWFETKITDLLENLTWENILAVIQGDMTLSELFGGAGSGTSLSGYSEGGGLDTGTGTTGGRVGGGGTDDAGTGQTVNNYFYGPVYFNHSTEDTNYDCPSPNPIISGTTGGRVVTSGLG